MDGHAMLVRRAGDLLATVAIHDAASAGADPEKLSGAWRDVARGDEEAARGRFQLAIECYQHAWYHAVRASTRLTIGTENGGQHLEVAMDLRSGVVGRFADVSRHVRDDPVDVEHEASDEIGVA